MRTNVFRKKIILVIVLTFNFLILLFNPCVEIQANTINYSIDQSSNLYDDLELLNVDLSIFSEKIEMQAITDMQSICIFKNESEAKMFLYMSYPSGYDIYRTKINEVYYTTYFCNDFVLNNNVIKKYFINYSSELPEHSLINITEYGFIKGNSVFTYGTNEKHYLGYEDNEYCYWYSSENTVMVEGKLFSYRYKATSDFEDFFNSLISLGNDKSEYRDLYYYAFSLYDKKTQREFKTDDISNVKLNYELTPYISVDTTELIGSSPSTTNKTSVDTSKTVEHNTDSITSQTETISKARRFFKRKFTYQTIEKVDNIKDNTLKTNLEADNYKYVINGVGSRNGFKVTKSSETIEAPGLGWYIRDTYKYKAVTSINIFEITYSLDNQEFTINVDSLSEIEDPDNPGKDIPPNLEKVPFWWEKIVAFLDSILEFFNKFKNVIIVILILILVVVLGFVFKGVANFIKTIFKGIVAVIKFPFKILSAIFNFLFK